MILITWISRKQQLRKTKLWLNMVIAFSSLLMAYTDVEDHMLKQQFLDTRDWPFGSVLSMVLTLAAVALAGAAAWYARRERALA